jgi:hypothetical protein
MTGALVVGLLGTAVSAFGMYQQSKSQENMAKYNEKVAENNAKSAEMRAHESVRRQRKQHKRQMAAQRQAYADSGVLDTGTPLTVMADTAATLELEAQDRFWAGRTQAQGFQQQANLHGAQAKSFRQARPFNVGSTLLTGVNQTAYRML